jgi:hypothetical protein
MQALIEDLVRRMDALETLPTHGTIAEMNAHLRAKLGPTAEVIVASGSPAN